MEQPRQGKSIGAKRARMLLEEVGGVRDPGLEGSYPPASRHQVYRLEDDRILDLFLKSARLYASDEEFLQDRSNR